MKRTRTRVPLGRPRAFDTAEALERAMLLFWRKGYLGTSMSDLTEAIGVNRPSLYAAFGNKEALFRKAVKRYFEGPAIYLRDALKEPTAREVVDRLLNGVVRLVTDPRTPRTCLWVHGALSCGDPGIRLRREFEKQRAQGIADLKARFQRAVSDGDLGASVDIDALAQFVQTVNVGLSVQAATGATRKELLAVVATAMRAWPDGRWDGPTDRRSTRTLHG